MLLLYHDICYFLNTGGCTGLEDKLTPDFEVMSNELPAGATLIDAPLGILDLNCEDGGGNSGNVPCGH